MLICEIDSVGWNRFGQIELNSFVVDCNFFDIWKKKHCNGACVVYIIKCSLHEHWKNMCGHAKYIDESVHCVHALST